MVKKIFKPYGNLELEQWRFKISKFVNKLLGVTDYLHHGTGTPEGAVTAPVGHIYFRDDGGTSTTLYVKESGTGNTGWVAK